MIIGNHPDLKKFKELQKSVLKLQELAKQHGIRDIFQDNGGKLLEILLITGLNVLPGRNGNDAIDKQGNEFEIKSVNMKLTKSFSTSHHVNPVVINKYRKAKWVFVTYEGIVLQAIYEVDAEKLESYFTKWETKWHKDGCQDINNPKISLKHVLKHGKCVYRSNEHVLSFI